MRLDIFAKIVEDEVNASSLRKHGLEGDKVALDAINLARQDVLRLLVGHVNLKLLFTNSKGMKKF